MSDHDDRYSIADVFAMHNKLWDERPDPMELFDRIAEERRAMEDEWRDAVRSMTEMDRAATESDIRRADGLTGDKDDARYE